MPSWLRFDSVAVGDSLNSGKRRGAFLALRVNPHTYCSNEPVGNREA